MDKCGDNRFEIIEKAKQDLLNSTNIDSSKDEMKVLDNFLFRCWQMGWLNHHNLTSDAEEGEEMLYVSRKRVQEMYAHYDKISNDSNRPKDYIESVYEYADGVTIALDDLFGSKCLPDEELKPAEPSEANCTKTPNSSTCTEDCPSQCPSQDFDTILKDSFRKERRLNVATQILSGIVASDKPYRHPVKRALELTDALLAELDKTKENGN